MRCGTRPGAGVWLAPSLASCRVEPGASMSVTVVMAARNAASHIGEAIASVLAQGPDVDALVIVDDGSSDGTYAIVRSFADSRIRLVASDGSGVSAARNAGARAAPGEWLMFLDADDRLRPG